ncbi:retropepsin-like aspartic protease [Nodularia harveyana UHCC-0300]|uniref:Retropepsin-like aspartic protease n=1 Tax=Nodularia harveyana UHCC-0300 TaxID=2974287 RepID=A0ABU5UGX7_9CYAN|nr:retropepsin-like aspartic protease [Nodularia harveyana]MEA5582739.1 retropepsin-like aspartic protease [Nodularia harveyana UHCC-0300]
MLQSFLSRATLIFLSSTLAVLGVACEQRTGSEGSLSETSQDTSGIINNQNSLVSNNLAGSPTIKPVAPLSQEAAKRLPPPEPEINFFEMGLDKAIGAWSISQSAQSSDDWKLVMSQYQDAIAFMEKVPPQSLEFTTAQAKIYEYRSHLKSAQQKASPPPTPSRNIIVAVPQAQIQPSVTPPKTQKHSPVTTQPTRSAFLTPEAEVFIVPIKRRVGGTPIVEVTFNNQQKFEMIVDTGASGTVITEEMANTLGVLQVGTVKANTASARKVEFPIGYVDSMTISGLTVNKVAVAIAGPELETGLLGHDFFGKYDVTIRRDVVEFSPQSHSQINSVVETRPAVPVFPKPNHSEEFP